jgi:hypothetical protein
MRKRDDQVAPDLIYFRHADPTIHDRMAVLAEGFQHSNIRRIRHVVGHAAGCRFGGTTPDAVQLARSACLLVLGSTSLKIAGEFLAEYQHRPLVIENRQPCFDPLANGVFVNPEEAGYLFDGIASVDFYLSVIWIAFGHESHPLCSLFSLG